MATVSPTVNRLAGSGDGSVITYSYTITTANADGAPIPMPEWADVTVIARGTWGGATLKVQGSDDGTNFVTTGLSNAAGGTEFSASADKVATLIERPPYIRPILTTAGSGATLTVVVSVRRAQPIRV